MSEPAMPTRDINHLHPTVRRGAQEFLARTKAAGLNVLITETFRTKAYQDSLYAKGRTAPGSIVTNLRGGQSMHEFRIAFDICKNVRGQEYSDTAFFNQCGKIWQDMGGEWGGNWASFPDKPHMQYTHGYTESQIRNGTRIPDNAQMLWERSHTTPPKEELPMPPTNQPIPSEWAKEAWAWALAKGITDGTNPQGSATREQVITLIYNALKSFP
ncbi:MAG: M15 family metallopeptidase [Defluviitaleaceae bacterium]|nr:M15 family metallopeptidase [Defluviitaleaceae bacterium]